MRSSKCDFDFDFNFSWGHFEIQICLFLSFHLDFYIYIFFFFLSLARTSILHYIWLFDDIFFYRSKFEMCVFVIGAERHVLCENSN